MQRRVVDRGRGGPADGTHHSGHGLPALAPPVGGDRYEQIRGQLRLKNQPWAKVNWRTNVTEARRAAAEARKPIFLVVNTGNCLGFV